MRVRTLLAAAVSAKAVLAANSSCIYPSLYSASIDDITTGFSTGCFTTVDLVKAYQARIAEVNDELNAVLEMNPDALDIAASLDAERIAGKIRGPLHGVPVMVKDNIATYDQMNNTAGSYALLGAKVPKDSGTVARLKAAGAIILGKTNLSQWAMYRSTNTTSGWSARGGQTYGPYYPKQDPCGSSSGSGVAAAIGLSFAALGTETRGSILEPASRGNIVGIKPSVGLTSRHLVVPITSVQDTVGPLARTVKDAASILSVIAGVDEEDDATLMIPNSGKIPDYVSATAKYSSLEGIRIGVPRNGFDDGLLYQQVNRSYLLDTLGAAIEVLRGMGAEIVDPANFSAAASAEIDWPLRSSEMNHQGINCAAGFVTDLAAYLDELTYNPNGIHSVAELRNYTIQDAREDHPDRNVGLFEAAIGLGYNLSDPRAANASKTGVELDAEGGVTGIINKFNLSALIMPTDYAPTWASSPGLPAISVPLGAYPDDVPILEGSRELIDVAPGIPFGITFLGKKWSEEELIAIAHVYEQATKFRDALVPGKNSIIPKAQLKDSVSAVTTSPASTPTPSSTLRSSAIVPRSSQAVLLTCLVLTALHLVL